MHGGAVILRANKKGMLSLAKQLLYFAYNDLPKWAHVHLDGFFTGIENQEIELIIEAE